MNSTQTISPTAAPAVDVPQLLTAIAAALQEQPTRILTHLSLTTTVLNTAPDLTAFDLRPVWEALPLGYDGAEHAEYAALLLMNARSL